MATVRIGRSGIHGRGVFAERALRRGEVAFRFEGPLVHASHVSQRGIQVWRDAYLEPRAPGRFINHACQPTAEVTRDLAVRARRALAAGEELTIDYSTVVLWELWRMRCACGARRCRRLVRAWGRSPARVRARAPKPLFAWLEEGRLPPGLRPGLARAATRWFRARTRGTAPRSRRARRGR